MLAQEFDIADEVIRCIALKRGKRPGPPGTPLIKNHNPVKFWIKEAPMRRV